MACTTQSALDYVKNARSRLLGKLKNLSVILENLRQKEVLSDEAVSKIQAEKDDYDKTRKILDWVKSNGEDACYEFLRIVDMTRKRTLEVDLHHWISCFPFREDAQMDTNYLQGPKPCHRYQAKLKLKARKTSNEFWTANKYLFEENNKPDLSYMSLVLDTQGSVSPSKIKKLKSKKSKMIRPKKLRTYVPEDKVGTSPGDLLKTSRDVLVVGKPGIGKTALTQEMLRLWAERDNEKLDYMFYFDMRETSHITKAVSLKDLLFNMFSEPDEGKEEVLQDIKNNSDNVTLIFDGMTDLSSSVVKRLVEKDLLPDAKIIVTCRQDDEDDEEVFSSEDFLRVEVKGFSEQTIKAYLAEMLGKEQKKVFSNVELLTLCHVPIYALMVAACFSFETPEDSPQPCTITEIYINIVRFCLQRNSNNLKTKDLNPFIKNKRKEILSLAEVAFNATEGKTVNLTELPCEDSCVLSFLKPLFTKVGPTKTKTTHAFLHYTMQEFFAALWLLKNPDKIKDVFQQCLTDERKHMKHLIPFMCRLLNEKSPSLTKCLIPAEELKNTSNWFFKEMITTFFTCLCEADTEDSGPDVDILFLCQCLYESQCPEACIHLLDKLGYHLDLSGESLDPLPCCAVAYVVTQSEERKVSLNLEDVRVSDQGMRRLFGCLKNVQWRDPLPLQLWKIFLLSEGQMDHLSLLGLDGNQLHLPVEGKRCLFEQAVKVMQEMSMKVNVCLHWDRETRVCQDLCESLFEALSYISSLSFRVTCRGPGLQDQKQRHGTLERKEKQLLLDLCLKAARHKGENFHNVVNTLLALFSVNTGIHNILLDFYQHVKGGEIPLKPVFQSAPAVWVIDLSKRKTSILLEVLKLQSEKKQVELTGWSDEESEVRSFLQCVPYISQLSVVPQLSEPSEEIRFLGNVFCAAAEREQQTGDKILELLSSVCTYQRFPLKNNWCDFLLDLYTHLKDYETQTGLSVLPSVQSVFQSAPAVWVIDLSERKTSILLEVLKLQSEKKQVELTGWSDEESEVRSFLQCVPYISQLSFCPRGRDSGEVKVCGNLFCAAAEREQQTGEKILELLSSLCSYQTFPLSDWFEDDDDDDEEKYQSDFLLDLCSHLKDYETQTGLSVLPSVQSVFQSAPAVWVIDLSERKTSILLEVLKLQSEKKQVELTGWSDEESEVRSFLQCVPYISQLSFCPWWGRDSGEVKVCGNLFCAAAEREQQTGEKILELLSSLCSYQTFPLSDWFGDDDDEEEKYQSDFLLDLCSHLKDYETQTGLSVLPSVQSVFQSAPAVWVIDLSERKTSILLEVLKLQSEKKQVELTGWSDEESEVRSFLLCLPYISQLSFCPRGRDSGEVKFCGNLFCAAAEREQQTGEKILELLSSLCSYQTFPLTDRFEDEEEYQSDFLLDLCSHLKDYETQTGLSVLPSVQSVFQSAPAVWVIDLSERKTSILLEVLKLQSEKKQVELRGWSDEESEVRSFLQCVPYISQLSFCPRGRDSGAVKVCGNLFCAAAEREQQTGEKILELLSSLCSYQRFPLTDRFGDDDEEKYQSDFLLDLCSHLKDYETQTGLSVLPSVQSVFQSAPAVWVIDLSERKTSILLEVLKLQSEKKQVELRGWSDEESEVRSFLQCVPYISQLSFCPRGRDSGAVKVCGNLFCAAAEREQQTGEKILELLSSLCSYQRFPLTDRFGHDNKYQSDFLLDLCSHLKDYETQTGLSVLPSVQSVFQSAPAVWVIDLSERKTSILLEVLKLQSENKQVELRGWSDEESEVRSFLQCVPYISQLSCGSGFFQRVCTLISVRSREEAEQLASLLQLLGFSLLLTGELHLNTCRTVGRVLVLCGSEVNLILTPRKISVRGASVLFRRTTRLHSLRLSNDMALLLCRWVRGGRVVCPVTVEELSLSRQRAQPSERVLLKVVSNVASLLRYWTVRRLDLTEFCVPAQGVIPLLLHDGPLTVKLSEEIFQQLLFLLHEIQDEDLTRFFLSKVGGDLTSCCVNWELLHYLLQQSSCQTFTVNLRKNSFLQKSITRLLPFLDRIVFKRLSPSFVLTAIREIYEARASPIIPSLLRSFDHVINLSCREMDSVDCAALLFTLRHSVRVKLNLLWSSIPAGETESILFTLDRVSQLSVDRNLLLRLVHCCAASDVQQGAAVDLLRTVQHRLDLSCSSCVALDQSETLSLTAGDCRVVSVVLRHSSQDTQVILQDCEVEDSGLDLLFPVLNRVRLRASKAVLLQLVSLVPVNSERDTVRRAVSLCRALGGELDFSHSTLDQRACGALALMLDSCEELTELDLSHCRLTDQLLLTLSAHLHKVQVLDLSHNNVTDASTDTLLQLVSANPSIHTVRLFGNKIVDRTCFDKHKFEIW
ncbi:hypothetical protein ABVT39_005394 [Epinephelus coioides]